MATAKSEAMVRTLKERLQSRLPDFVFTDGRDANGNPALAIAEDATPATTEEVVVVRVQPQSLLFSNAIGGTQENFSPHYVDVCMENSSTTGISVLSTATLSKVQFEIDRLYGVTRYYLTPAATVPAIASISAQMVDGNLVATVIPEPQATGVVGS